MPSDSWESFCTTPEGMKARLEAFRRRGIHLFIEGEPQSKKSMTPPGRASFQKAVLNQLARAGRRAFRGDVAVEIEFFTASATPPHLHTAVKCLLDLLATPGKGLSRRKALCYGDDRQIKALSATYYITPRGRKDPASAKTGTAVRLYPFRGFVEALELVEALHPEDEESARTGAMDRYLDFRDEVKTWTSPVQEKTLAQLEVFKRHEAQNEALQSMRLTARHLLFFYQEAGLTPRQANGSHFEQFTSEMTSWLRSDLLRLTLPTNPTSRKEAKHFKQRIREQLFAFRRRLGPLMEPLRTQVGLDVVYKPPQDPANFGRDLDNVMTSLLPIFHEVFEPPSVPSDALRLPGSEIQAPGSIRHSVGRYSIYWIPRGTEDLDPGYINLHLSNEFENSGGPLRRTLDVVEGRWTYP